MDKNLANSVLTQSQNDDSRILIVDDEEHIRNILSRFFIKQGYRVDTARDGCVAIEMLQESEYDVVLTDLSMPNLDGRGLLTAMADQFPDIPKIVLTGMSYKDDIILALKTGAYDFISKPIIDFDILQHAIERALDKKRLIEERTGFINQQSLTNEIISMLNTGAAIDDIIKKLAITLKKIIPFKRLTLNLFDENNNNRRMRQIEPGKSDKLLIDSPLPCNVDDPLLHQIHLQKELLKIDKIESHLLQYHDSELAKYLNDDGIQSALILPLIIESNVRGFLILDSDEPGAFGDSHISFIKSIAGHISISIHRNELLSELEKHTHKLEELVKKRTSEVINTQKTTIFALSSLADARDADTGQHLIRIRQFSILIARILKYSQSNHIIDNAYLRDLYDSSILHDIGKVGIPDSILLKPGQLSKKEFDIIKMHTTVGYNALKEASRDLGDDSFLNMAMDITLYHHERWDGLGYPKGLMGEDIPLAARIVTIADIYDVLTTARPYKPPYPHETAMDIMEEEKNRFDPDLYKIFIENESEFNKIRLEKSEN